MTSTDSYPIRALKNHLNVSFLIFKEVKISRPAAARQVLTAKPDKGAGKTEADSVFIR
jgi:hypothetical protein